MCWETLEYPSWRAAWSGVYFRQYSSCSSEKKCFCTVYPLFSRSRCTVYNWIGKTGILPIVREFFVGDGVCLLWLLCFKSGLSLKGSCVGNLVPIVMECLRGGADLGGAEIIGVPALSMERWPPRAHLHKSQLLKNLNLPSGLLSSFLLCSVISSSYTHSPLWCHVRVRPKGPHKDHTEARSMLCTS
jgi:hypothetical protein